MILVTNFKEKRMEKQRNFEKCLLKELNIREIKKQINSYIGSNNFSQTQDLSCIETRCVDIALEAYLLGGTYSKLGHYGESFEKIKERTKGRENFYVEELSTFIEDVYPSNYYKEELFNRCKSYVQFWFREGFEKGKMKYRLRLVR